VDIRSVFDVHNWMPHYSSVIRSLGLVLKSAEYLLGVRVLSSSDVVELHNRGFAGKSFYWHSTLKHGM